MTGYEIFVYIASAAICGWSIVAAYHYYRNYNDQAAFAYVLCAILAIFWQWG